MQTFTCPLCSSVRLKRLSEDFTISTSSGNSHSVVGSLVAFQCFNNGHHGHIFFVKLSDLQVGVGTGTVRWTTHNRAMHKSVELSERSAQLVGQSSELCKRSAELRQRAVEIKARRRIPGACHP